MSHQFTSGRPVPNAMSFPSLAVFFRGVRTPPTIPGIFNDCMASILLDAGASSSVACSNLRWVSYESSSRLAQPLAGNDSVLRPDGQACSSVGTGYFTTKNTSVCARIQWGVILDMDFLDPHHASNDFAPLRICLEGIEFFRTDTLAAIANGP
nr:unnamed protein product [Spirometra erinaceieuropaei]